MRHIILLAIGAALAGCGPGTAVNEDAAPAASAALSAGFRHDPSADLFGYYMPTAPVAAGELRLQTLAIGSPDEFRQWEGRQRSDAYAPVMLIFDDVKSPMQPTETGGEVHAVQVRVLPSSYVAAGEEVRFAGSDRRLGAVDFEGRFDAAAVKAAQDAQSSGSPAPQSPVLRGKLRLGARTHDVAFTWFGGD